MKFDLCSGGGSISPRLSSLGHSSYQGYPNAALSGRLGSRCFVLPLFKGDRLVYPTYVQVRHDKVQIVNMSLAPGSTLRRHAPLKLATLSDLGNLPLRVQSTRLTSVTPTTSPYPVLESICLPLPPGPRRAQGTPFPAKCFSPTPYFTVATQVLPVFSHCKTLLDSMTKVPLASPTTETSCLDDIGPMSRKSRIELASIFSLISFTLLISSSPSLLRGSFGELQLVPLCGPTVQRLARSLRLVVS